MREIEIKKRKRPNYFENRHNQFALAGKIAVKTNAINPYNPNGKVASVYQDNNGNISYSLVGQTYLTWLGLTIKEL
ncbi:MAG: hypothetical protein M0R44_11375 [Candidatus Marinimicrobia bacterium]|jgi:hypothetical protein|nr:hypothetical protein [Candidatus Neomarinimicrobiota bacterium]